MVVLVLVILLGRVLELNGGTLVVLVREGSLALFLGYLICVQLVWLKLVRLKLLLLAEDSVVSHLH